MSEEALLDALAARLLPDYKQSIERMAEFRERLAALSDDEWWEQRLKRRFDVNPALAERMGPHREEMLRQRHAMLRALGDVNAMQMARHRAEEILPALLKVRRRRKAKGPITDNQFRWACMRTDLTKIVLMRAKMKRAAKETTDPRRKRILSHLPDNILLDLKALRGLQRPGLDEKGIEKAAQEIGSRFQLLAEEIPPARNPEP